ncbi:MAG: hypothetical protein IJ715_04630 [Bacilli bacterium]|nr:hypothetical protein [Bacilli bacterium]
MFNEIYLDTDKTVGTKFLLTEVKEKAVYENGKPTGAYSGYKYTVSCMEKGLKQINVSIPGTQQVSLSASDDFKEVSFKDLTLKAFIMNNRIQFSASATGITEIKEK